MEFEADIIAVAFGGKGIARVDGKVWFVRSTVPEDRVLLSPIEDGDRYGQAEVVSFLKKSPLRSETAPCKVFGTCGGCHWQDISYDQQLEWKKNFLVSNLQRVGKISSEFQIEISKSPSQYNYRDRILVRVHIGSQGKTSTGYFKAESRELVAIDECYLANPKINEFLRRFSSLVFENNSNQTFRMEIQVIPRDLENNLYVTIFPAEGKNQNLQDVIHQIQSVSSVRWAGLVFDLSKSEPELFEVDLGVNFIAAPGQFHQVNLAHNKILRRMVRDETLSLNPQRVLDVFCGSGNLTMPIANSVEYLEGVELNPRSIRHAKLTADENGFTNTKWFVGDGVKHLSKLEREKAHFDLVVLDPPREGIFHGLNSLLSMRPGHIIYISCDPVTLSRDLGHLCKNGYMIEKISCLDFFPNTYHVESIAVLKNMNK